MFFVHPVRLPHERYENLSKTRIYKLEQAAQANYFTYEKTESELNSQKKKKIYCTRFEWMMTTYHKNVTEIFYMENKKRICDSQK